MSKIFEALKRAQQSRASLGAGTDPLAPRANRRRWRRWTAHIPVFIYGHGANRQPFHEEGYSTNVSELGALLVMTATVRPGQTLLLTNKMTQTTLECRVVHISGRDLQTIAVAVEFPTPARDFWRVTAPPQAAESLAAAPERSRAR